MAPPILDDLREDHGRSFGWALACCGWEHELAEDVLQESYLRVLDGRAEFAGRSSVRTWFFAVVKRVAGELLSTRQRHSRLNLTLVASEASALQDNGSEMDQALEKQESSVALRCALMMLSQRQREVLHLVYYLELTVEEAAETLDVSVGSARTHFHRGKQQLAKAMNLVNEHEH